MKRSGDPLSNLLDATFMYSRRRQLVFGEGHCILIPILYDWLVARTLYRHYLAGQDSCFAVVVFPFKKSDFQFSPILRFLLHISLV